MTAMTKRETQLADAMQLESIHNQLSALLNSNPREMEKFRTRMIKMSTSFMLKDCSPESLINCGLQALTLNLPLEAGQGYVVKYGSDAQLDVGYKGWQMLAKRDGISVLADPVYSCDLFEQTGFGFDAVMKMEPNHSARQSADDAWVLENIKGVIVSVKEDASGQVVHKFVARDMLFKIVGMSPSIKSDKAKKFSPHENWREQMLCAKAIKQVVSKMPIDLANASALSDAIEIVSQTEAAAQANAQPTGPQPYSAERFEENWPKWVKLVESGQKKALTIITQMSNGFALTQGQMQTIMTLTRYEPIEGEAAEVVDEATDGETDEPMAEAS